jgi:hypothetical protein
MVSWDSRCRNDPTCQSVMSLSTFLDPASIPAPPAFPLVRVTDYGTLGGEIGTGQPSSTSVTVHDSPPEYYNRTTSISHTVTQVTYVAISDNPLVHVGAYGETLTPSSRPPYPNGPYAWAGFGDLSGNCPGYVNPVTDWQDILGNMHYGTQPDYDLDGRGDVCDNCREVANASQTDADGDNIGDKCDVCVHDANNDADGDGRCADVDNCPWQANIDQADIDGNGVGDACDCADGYVGPGEIGPDCGGVCLNACPPFTFLCKPLVYHGSSFQRCDIVLIPDGNDYSSNMSTFLNRARLIVQDSLYKTEILDSNRDKFNVWYSPRFANVTWDQYEMCDWTTPNGWRDDCPFADLGGILHENTSGWGSECRDYSQGDVFSCDLSRDDHNTVFVHELSHSLFGLADEYDDSTSVPPCTTSYDSGDALQGNVWDRKSDCQDGSLHGADCYKFTSCVDWWTFSSGHWKADPDGDIMSCPGAGSPLVYYTDCASAVTQTLSMWGYVVTAGVWGNSTGERSVILAVEWHTGSATLNGVKIVEGMAPDVPVVDGGLRVKVKAADSSLLLDKTMLYPVFRHYMRGGGDHYVDDVQFEVVIPFLPGNPRLVELSDTRTNTAVGTLDLGGGLINACAGKSIPECVGLDLDADNVPDINDNCPLYANADQADYDGDHVGDICDSDVDGDSIDDAQDLCPWSALNTPVDPTGCTIDQLCPCNGPTLTQVWKNHGGYVSCVAHETNRFEGLGIISKDAKGAIVSNAAQSTCGK